MGTQIFEIRKTIEPEAKLEREALEELEKSFGTNWNRKEILVGEGITLSKLHKMSK